MKFWNLTVFICLFTSSVWAQKPDLVGRWEAMDNKEIVIFTLNEDGGGSFDGISFIYTIEGNELVATYFFGIFHYQYEIIWNQKKTKILQLKLSEGNLDSPYVFTRADSPKGVKQPKILIREIDTELVGDWADENHKVSFNEKGKVTVDGNEYRYETNQGFIKIYKDNKMSQAPYSVFQTTLAMAFDGDVWQLKRKK